MAAPGFQAKSRHQHLAGLGFQATSCHQHLAGLGRPVRLGEETSARVTAEHDPAAWRRGR
ncbi:hypothetical protein AB0392_33805 [Nonomuraea angiospora]|uniref:hypothetical protein n=1 Tax=Nonomuraea angiospora TaxID=46172 RepID=UPI00344B71E0